MPKLHESLNIDNDSKMLLLGRVAVGVAHDLNNMLHAISAYADLVLDRSDDNLEITQDLNKLLTVSSRAKETVRQILSYACEQSVEHEPFHMTPILEEIIQQIRVTSSETLHQICGCTCTNDIVVGNATQIYKGIMNVAMNAVQAMGHSGSLHIYLYNLLLKKKLDGQLGEIQPGEYLILEVTDTGPGIDAAVIDRIFEPFFTTKPHGSGLGMGLSILGDVMASHQGNVQLQSSATTGTQFRLFFPQNNKRDLADTM